MPALAVLAVTTLGWLALWPLLPQRQKRGLAQSLFWIPFYGYGTMMDGIRRLLGTQEMAGPGTLVAVAMVLLLAGGAALYRLRVSPRHFDGLTHALNRVSSFAVAVSVVACGLGGTSQAPQISHGAGQAAAPDLTLPDIYFIVCDAYPRADVLQNYFHFDNRPFLQDLQDRGFYIAERSRSNYGSTHPSLASTLNFDYLDPDLVPKRHFETVPELSRMVRENKAARLLKLRGYEVVDLTLGLFGGALVDADRVIRPQVTPYTEFQQYLIDMTPARSILNRLTPLRSHRLVPFQLDTLAGLRRTDRPLFVYTHIYAPHVPHSYDKNGAVLASPPPYQTGMGNVVTFLNGRLIEVIDTILTREPNSVIVIEGDHGCNSFLQCPEYYGTQKRSDEDYIRDRSANLSVFYFPDRLYEGFLYPEITPVNTFRMIFTKYLGMDLPRISDTTYLRAQDSFDIVPIAEVH